MVRQFIEVGNADWFIYVFYEVGKSNKQEITDFLLDLDCPRPMLKKAVRVLTTSKNTGLTFTNDELKTSLICISDATSAEQFVNTAIHESKHVQSHICAYYNVDEDGELAAYLIGHIVLRMYKMLQRLYYNG